MMLSWVLCLLLAGPAHPSWYGLPGAEANDDTAPTVTVSAADGGEGSETTAETTPPASRAFSGTPAASTGAPPTLSGLSKEFTAGASSLDAPAFTALATREPAIASEAATRASIAEVNAAEETPTHPPNETFKAPRFSLTATTTPFAAAGSTSATPALSTTKRPGAAPAAPDDDPGSFSPAPITPPGPLGRDMKISVGTKNKRYLIASCTVVTRADLVVLWKIGNASVNAFGMGTRRRRATVRGVMVDVVVGTVNIPWGNVLPLSDLQCAACVEETDANGVQTYPACVTGAVRLPCPGPQRTDILFSTSGDRAACVTSNLPARPVVRWTVAARALPLDYPVESWSDVGPGECGVLRSEIHIPAMPRADPTASASYLCEVSPPGGQTTSDFKFFGRAPRTPRGSGLVTMVTVSTLSVVCLLCFMCCRLARPMSLN
ncbi:envelope glycoprotein J [Equid alphaherpesvirus 3]|uniref:Envelope glycoprotein J n=1 Tax=Equid alphaherpesvirus 3 TaxID=80341 RepID=A0A077B7P4_9ALPH|nr:envelope glycoprotein J [Equid alphaherpesvirus 3]AIL02989.1 envelope glycoprotein J [Equid alphaherpesvirus 3]